MPSGALGRREQKEDPAPAREACPPAGPVLLPIGKYPPLQTPLLRRYLFSWWYKVERVLKWGAWVLSWLARAGAGGGSAAA